MGLYLQHTHAVSAPKDLVGLRVVAIADVGRCNKQFKGIVLFDVKCTTLELLLKLTHTLLAVTVCVHV